MSKKSHVLTVDLTELGGQILDDLVAKIAKESGKKPTKVQVIRNSLVAYYALDLYREPERILRLYEEQYDGTVLKGAEPAIKNPMSKGHRKATENDHKLVDVYVDTYSLPNKKGVFWPPFLRAVGNCINEGMSYDDLEKVIKVSPDEPWIAREYPTSAPPLHVLFSEKVLSRLVLLAAQKAQSTNDEGETAQTLARRRDSHMREIKHRLGPVHAGKFYRLSSACETTKELDALRAEILQVHGKTLEQMEDERTALVAAKKAMDADRDELLRQRSLEANKQVTQRRLTVVEDSGDGSE